MKVRIPKATVGQIRKAIQTYIENEKQQVFRLLKDERPADAYKQMLKEISIQKKLKHDLGVELSPRAIWYHRAKLHIAPFTIRFGQYQHEVRQQCKS